MLAYQAEAQLIRAVDFPPLRRTREDIRQATSLFYGALTDGKLVAACELELDGKNLEIHSLIVHPDYWRQGYGSALLGFVLARHEFEEVSVSTAQLNAPARSLFAKHGFSIIGRWMSPENIACVDLTRSDPRRAFRKDF